jgi:hypothetical protein
MPKTKKVKVKTIKRKIKEINKDILQEDIFETKSSLPGKIRVFRRNLDQKVKEIAPNVSLEENRVHLPTISDEETKRPFNYSSRSYSSSRGYDTNTYRSNNSDGMSTETNSIISKREDLNQSRIERNDNLRIDHFNNQNEKQDPQKQENYTVNNEPTKKEKRHEFMG